MKEYIVIRDDVPDEFVPVICAHASLIAHLNFSGNEQYDEWIKASFKKAVVCANQKEWSKALESLDYKVITESALGGREVAAVFCPRESWANVFKFMRLWKPVEKR